MRVQKALSGIIAGVKRKKGMGSYLYSFIVYVLLIDLAFIFLYPFLYMLVTSFKSYNDVLDTAVKWYPKEFHPQNWAVAFKSLDFFQNFKNSVLVTVLATAGHIASCSFIAYGFSRYKFPFSNFAFALVIVTITVPFQTIMVPQSILYSKMGWNGGHLPLIIPTFFGFGLRGGLFIFLFRQYFIKIPAALEEAAYVDGCNPYKTFFKIILPSSGPVMLVCVVLSFVWHWNDFSEPFLYITKPGKFLLPQALPEMFSRLQSLEAASTEGEILLRQTFHTGVVMAGTAIAILPLLILYLAVQNRFVESIDRTGLVE